MGPARDFVEVTGLQPVLCSGQVASLGPKRLKTSQKGTQNSGGESNHSVYVFFFSYFPLLIDFDRFWMILVVFNGCAPNARRMLNLPKRKNVLNCANPSLFLNFRSWFVDDRGLFRW
jgi:hypothetical protein